MRLDQRLLEVLVCPACRAEVRPDHPAEELVCQGCGLAYPVRDDIPVMLVDEARRPGVRRDTSPRDPTAAAQAPDNSLPDNSLPDNGAAGADGPGDPPPSAAETRGPHQREHRVRPRDGER